MSKCKICETEYYLGDNIDPDEPCWCREYSTEKIYDLRTFLIHYRIKIYYFLYKIIEKLIPKEMRG